MDINRMIRRVVARHNSNNTCEPSPKSVVKKAKMVRTAGEVRFIKDRGGSKDEWGWGSPGPSERELSGDFTFEAKKLKPLAGCLRATLMALGHVQTAYGKFTKTKSAQVSPDGNLGGRGYIMKIADMRRQYMNCSEALSALSDTLYDELNAPHWNPAIEEQSNREREEVVEIMSEVEEIKKDPEAVAEEQQEDWVEEHEGGDEKAPGEYGGVE